MSLARDAALFALVPLLLLGCASSSGGSADKQAGAQAGGTGSLETSDTPAAAEPCVFDRNSGRWKVCRSSSSGHCIAYGETCNPPPGK